MGSVIAKAFACAVAGTLAWVIFEPQFPKVLDATTNAQWGAIETWFLFSLGALVGLAAGMVHGLRQGGRHNLVMSSVLGLVFGAMGIGFGQSIGGALYQVAGGTSTGGNPIARVVSFLPMGLMLGAAVGASQRSVRALVSGGLGGAIAGFLTGAMFDPLSQFFGRMALTAQASAAANGAIVEIGAPGRAVTAMGLGLLIGLFTAIVELMTRRAWLRLVLGRNEGKEWPIDAAQTLIGRDERAHIPLFMDNQIPPLAAVINRQGGEYVLHDPGSPMGVGHNGVRVGQAVLKNGDTIQVGPLNFEFCTRSGSGSFQEGRAHAVPIGGPRAPVTAPQAAPAPAAVPALVVTSGPLTGHRLNATGPTEIGREAPGFALSTDTQASRRHALVAPTPAGLQVTDLGSTNGTFVNGHRVQTAQLSPGDMLTIGSTVFRVE